MRRRWFGRLAWRSEILDFIEQFGDLSLQSVDLAPLRKDGVVQFCDFLLLVGDARLQRLEARSIGIFVIHAELRKPEGLRLAAEGCARFALFEPSSRETSWSVAWSDPCVAIFQSPCN